MKFNALQLHLLDDVMKAMPISDVTLFMVMKDEIKKLRDNVKIYEANKKQIQDKYFKENFTSKDWNLFYADGTIIPKEEVEKAWDEILAIVFEIDFDSEATIYEQLVRFLDLYTSKQIPALKNEQNGMIVFGELLDMFAEKTPAEEKERIIQQFVKLQKK